MSTQQYRYPQSASVTVAAVGSNLTPIPTSSILIAAENPSLNLQPLQTDSSGYLYVNVAGGSLTVLNPSVSLTGSAVPADATYIGMNVSGNLTGLVGTANGLKVDGSAVTQPVSAVSLPLPSGASTSALQTTGNTSLASIVSQLPGTLGIKTSALSLSVAPSSDGVFAVSASALPLPSGAATSALQTTGNTSLASIVTNTTGLALAAQLPATLGIKTSALSLSVAPSSDGVFAVSATALPLPSGAATSANQATEITSLASIVTNTANIPAKGQATMANSTPVAIASDQSNVPTSQGGRTQANAPVRNDYSSVNVTTAAYVQLIASTTTTANLLEIFDSSGQVLAIATGAAASEVIQFYIYPGGNGQVPFKIAAGTRVSVKAITATASAGQLVMNLYT